MPPCPEPDILINNAGGPPPGDFRDWDRAAWIRALDANMLTPIELIKATVDGMIARRFGRIVNITSSAVKAPIDILGLSNGARSGLTGFVAGLARKVAAHNVTINNLLPGSFDTDRLRTTMEARAKAAGKSMAEVLAAGAAAIPAGRFGQRDEFGAACAFLCSVHAGYIVGPEHPAGRRQLSRHVLTTVTRGRPDDRPLLLDHAERPQDHDLPRRNRARAPRDPGQHQRRRAVRAGVSRDLAEQPDSGHRRSCAGRRRRVRCR